MIRAVLLAFILFVSNSAFAQIAANPPGISPSPACGDQGCSLGVQNAASNSSGIAPGSLVLLFPFVNFGQSGTGISAVSAVLLPDGSSQPIPLTLIATPCAGYPVGNVNCVTTSLLTYIPRETPIGMATITVDYGNDLSAVGAIEIVETSFGLYTISLGVGPARAQNLTANGAETNNLIHPAHPRDYMTLWGTGLGHATIDQVTVTLAGLALKPSYAGPSADMLGLDQINVQMPDDSTMPEGCYVPVSVKIGDTVSNTATLSLSRTRTPCQHPFSLSPDLLSKLDSGGLISLGLIDLYSSIAPPQIFPFGYVRTEAVSAEFQSFDANDMALLSMYSSQPTISGVYATPSVDPSSIAIDYLNGCQALPSIIYNSTATTTPTGVGISQFASGLEPFPFNSNLNVGDKVDINGPGGKAISLLGVVTSEGGGSRSVEYPTSSSQTFTVDTPDHLPPAFFSAGDWRGSAPGGADTQPFSVTLTLPNPIQISNFDQLKAFDHNKDLTISWDPKGYSTDDFLKLRWDASITDPQGDIGSGGLICRVPAAAGKLTIPATLLAGFSNPLYYSSIQVDLDRRPGTFKTFSIPLKDGTLVPGVFRYHSAESFQIFFQQ